MKTVEILFWIGLFIVFYTYVGYGIILFLLVKIKEIFSKSENNKGVRDLPEVTLLIAAYNEESVVDSKMTNCLELDYPTELLKIVWVTDGSDDNTNTLLANYQRADVLFEPARGGKTAAVNRAMDYIKSPIVVLTDANTYLNKEAIMEIVTLFNDPKVGCVAGEKRVLSKDKDTASAGGEGLYWMYESKLKDLDSRLYSAVGAAGELYAVRRELYKHMEKSVLLDDFIQSMQIAMRGYKIAYSSKAYAAEGASLDMNEEKKRKVRIAAGGLQSVAMLLPLLNLFKYGMLSFQYISHRVLRWTLTPIFLFLLLPMNLLLVNEYPNSGIYLTLLALQILFYVGGYMGFVLADRNLKNKVLFVPYYFLFMNINVFRGAKYLYKKGKGSGIWEKAKRA